LKRCWRDATADGASLMRNFCRAILSGLLQILKIILGVLFVVEDADDGDSGAGYLIEDIVAIVRELKIAGAQFADAFTHVRIAGEIFEGLV